jgi:D-xylose reductase
MSATTTVKQTITLKSGDEMPLVGLGTWKAEKGVVSKAVASAIENGYRLIDGACDYGNEVEVGEGLRAGIAAAGIERKDVFLTSKLWNTFHAKEHVRAALLRTLSDLGVDYLDLYLVHFPIALKYVDFEHRYPPEWTHEPGVDGRGEMVFADVPVEETWREMEKLVDDGLVRNIGVSNFSASLIMDLNKYAHIKPAVLQIEHHPFLQQPKLVEYAQRVGIAITAYSSFGQLSYLSLGPSFDWAKALPNLVADDDTVVAEISRKHNRSPAQVILRWTVQRNIAVIPKSTNAERLKQNLDILSFELSAQDLQAIATLDANHRFNDPGNYANYPIFD